MAVKAEDMRVLAADLAEAVGFDEEDAAGIAEIIVTNDMRGISSHGMHQFLNYMKQANAGILKTNVKFDKVLDMGAIALLDAEHGSGLLSGKKAAELAIERAKKYNIGAVGVKNTHHSGAVGYYAALCAEQNMIGIAMGSTNPVMTIPGCKGRQIGNNPFACAVPTPDGPMLLDIALSATAAGKLSWYASQNKPLPEGMMLDKDGNPSTNFDDFAEGSLTPMAGHKGYGLALMVETLCGVLTGSGVTSQNKDWILFPDHPNRFGQFLIAIPVDVFISAEQFMSNMDFMRHDLLDGHENAKFPGDIENASWKKCSEQGIELIPDLIQRLKAFAEDVGKLDSFKKVYPEYC